VRKTNFFQAASQQYLSTRSTESKVNDDNQLQQYLPFSTQLKMVDFAKQSVISDNSTAIINDWLEGFFPDVVLNCLFDCWRRHGYYQVPPNLATQNPSVFSPNSTFRQYFIYCA